MKYLLIVIALIASTNVGFCKKKNKKTTTEVSVPTLPQTANPEIAKPKYDTILTNSANTINNSNIESEILQSIKTLETYKGVSNPDWIKEYYIANGYLKLSSITQKSTMKIPYYELALKIINTNKNDEFLVLKALTNFQKIKPKNTTNAQLIEEGLAILETAKALNTENPRVFYLIGLYNNLLAKENPEKLDFAKTNIVMALEKYKTANHSNPLLPNWGAEEASTLLSNLGR